MKLLKRLFIPLEVSKLTSSASDQRIVTPTVQYISGFNPDTKQQSQILKKAHHVRSMTKTILVIKFDL